MISPQESLEQRVERLERLLAARGTHETRPWELGVAIVAGVAALALALLGVGLPNHYYQPLFALWICLLAYYRNLLRVPQRWFQFALPVLNVALIMLLLKLVIGSGERHPFFWVKFPTLTTTKVDQSWSSLLPAWRLAWENSFLADWSCDVTAIQTFLLFLVVLGSLLRFHPFTSLVAFLLVLFSLPAFATFQWGFVFPALVLGASYFYVQLPRDAGRAAGV